MSSNRERMDEESSDGERPDEESSDGERPDEESSDGERPDEESSDGERPDEESSNSERPDGERPGGERPDEVVIIRQVYRNICTHVNPLVPYGSSNRHMILFGQETVPEYFPIYTWCYFTNGERLNPNVRFLPNVIDDPLSYPGILENIHQFGGMYCSLISLFSIPLDWNSLYMQMLNLRDGHRFLCVGSRNGLVNVIAGMLVGARGVNHGIEINQNFMDVAHENTVAFKRKFAAVDYHSFCDPHFLYGNFFQLSPSTMRYDRIYCATSISVDQLRLFIDMLNDKGVMVGVFEHTMYMHIRQDVYNHRYYVMCDMPVVQHTERDIIPLGNPAPGPLAFPPESTVGSLQSLCRDAVRTAIRTRILSDDENVSMVLECPAGPAAPGEYCGHTIRDGKKFVEDRQTNEMSKAMKAMIDGLAMPKPLKMYLNYAERREDDEYDDSNVI